MSWTDDTLRHEGYVTMVFADGKLGGGIYADGRALDDRRRGPLLCAK
jgi:prepilin-type processing-associated H-X9-DG protein